MNIAAARSTDDAGAARQSPGVAARSYSCSLLADMMLRMAHVTIRMQLRADSCLLTIRQGLWALALFPSLLHAQGAAREALASFPADTQQMVYLSLAQLRSQAEWPQIRERVLTRQLRDFQDFMRSVGVDPERDVDEVVLGWRGEANTGLVGRAEGRFDTSRLRALVTRQNLPLREYLGHELYAFGSGEGPTDLLFVFFNESSAAFGRARDLRDLLDVRAGTKPALESNSAFVAWEAELEGTAPQWGVATGKAAASTAGPWLAAGGKLATDTSGFFAPLKAVLYRVTWGGSTTTNVTIVCESQETADAFSRLLTMLRDARPTGEASPLPAGFSTLLEGLEVHASGSRVELSASAPLEVLDQVLRVGPR
jgi:hypothetical protein